MDSREILINAGKRLITESFTVETWGNISVRDDDGLIYITPSGMKYDRCTVDDIVSLTPIGEIVTGTRVPSIEKDLHLQVYHNRSDINAIIHTHPIYSTIFGCIGEGIPLIIDEAAQALGSEIITAPYALPGSQELADNCAQALGSANACLLQSHGAVCVGKDMDDAFRVARVLEMTAEIYWKILAIGGSYKPISQQNILLMQKFVSESYGQKSIG